MDDALDCCTFVGTELVEDEGRLGGTVDLPTGVTTEGVAMFGGPPDCLAGLITSVVDVNLCIGEDAATPLGAGTIDNGAEPREAPVACKPVLANFIGEDFPVVLEIYTAGFLSVEDDIRYVWLQGTGLSGK